MNFTRFLNADTVNDRIFIQIAAYRDPQLVPTIVDALENASEPKHLRFCVAWQHGPEESLGEIKDHAQVEIIDIPHTESRGACWARHQIQKRFCGEEYTLCLDSHHRFVQGWDTKCIEMLRLLQEDGIAKPLLTTYASPFVPANDPRGRSQQVMRMDFDRFIPEGAIFFRPSAMPQKTPKPVPSRFLSAHFIFTLGQFCTEVPYDPEFYFHGEEISLAVRAFTHGYDLFHPNETILWHEYTRKGREKHWDDHKNWHLMNEVAHSRNRQLLGGDGPSDTFPPIDFGPYGLGTTRTLRDYERYAGVHFGLRAVHEHTLLHRPLPVPGADLPDSEWEKAFSFEFEHTIQATPLAEWAQADIDFCCVAYDDASDQQIFRRDLAGEALQATFQGAMTGMVPRQIQIPNRFYVPRGRRLQKWVLWPHCRTSGWQKKLEGEVQP